MEKSVHSGRREQPKNLDDWNLPLRESSETVRETIINCVSLNRNNCDYLNLDLICRPCGQVSLSNFTMHTCTNKIHTLLNSPPLLAHMCSMQRLFIYFLQPNIVSLHGHSMRFDLLSPIYPSCFFFFFSLMQGQHLPMVAAPFTCPSMYVALVFCLSRMGCSET